jgi:hypothetical protein
MKRLTPCVLAGCANCCANDSVQLQLNRLWQRCGEVRRPVLVRLNPLQIRASCYPGQSNGQVFAVSRIGSGHLPNPASTPGIPISPGGLRIACGRVSEMPSFERVLRTSAKRTFRTAVLLSEWRQRRTRRHSYLLWLAASNISRLFAIDSLWVFPV